MGIHCSKTRIIFFLSMSRYGACRHCRKQYNSCQKAMELFVHNRVLHIPFKLQKILYIPLYFFLSQFLFIFISYTVGTLVFDSVDQCIAQEKQTIFPYKDRTSHSQSGVSQCALNVAKFRSITKSLIFKRIFRGEHNHKLNA